MSNYTKPFKYKPYVHIDMDGWYVPIKFDPYHVWTWKQVKKLSIRKRKQK